MVYYVKKNVLGLIVLLAHPVLATITVSAPAANSSITECNNITLYYHPTGSFSTYVTVEVHQNNTSGPVVKTYSNVGSGAIYLSQDYNNILNPSGIPVGNYQIKVYDYYNPSQFGWSGVFHITAVPSPVISDPPIQVTTTSFEMVWTGAATSYKVDVSKNDPNFGAGNILSAYNGVTVNPPDQTGYYVTAGITAGTDYYFRARSMNGTCISGYSNVVHVITLPNAPSLSSPTEITSNSFSIAWNSVNGAAQYYVELSTNINFSPLYHAAYPVSTNSFSITNLSPLNVTYFIKVRAKNNAGGYSSYSGPKGVYLQPPPTAYPATNLTSTQFKASWTPSDTHNFSNFFIDVSTSPGFGTFVAPYHNYGVGTGPSYTVTGLQANIPYYYVVRGQNYVDNGLSASSNVVTAITCPAAPTLHPVSAGNITSTSFPIDWTNTSNSYLITVSQGGNIVSPYDNYPVSADNYTVTGLSSSTAYTVKVKATNTSCSSSDSNIVTVTTSPGPPGILPISNNNTCNSFQINWTPNGGTTFYVYVCDNSNFTGCNTPITTTAHYVVIGNLTANQTYYFKLQSSGSNGALSPYSDVSSTAVAPCAPTATTPILIDPSGTFVANWNPVSGATSYQIDVYHCDQSYVPFGCGVNETYQSYSVGPSTSLAIVPVTCVGTIYSATDPSFYRVTAVNGSGIKSVTSNSIPVVIGNYIPNVNGNTGVTSNSFTANWFTVTNAMGYDVDLSTDPNFGSLEPGSPFHVTTNYKSFSNLTPSTTYYWQVRSIVNFSQNLGGCNFTGSGTSANSASTACIGCRGVAPSNASSVTTLEQEEIDLYPNPTTGKLYFRIPGNDPNTQITIYDERGIKMSVPVTWQETILVADISLLRRGMYFVSICTGNRQETRKVLKE